MGDRPPGWKPKPLPKLPRASDPTKSRAPRNSAAPPIMRVREADEVKVQEDLYGSTMGGTETGRWFDTTTQNGSVGGRCWKCGRLRKAENLSLYVRPFGKGEVWICKEGDCA